AKLARVRGPLKSESRIAGNGSRFVFEYKGADTAIVVNRLLSTVGTRVSFERPSQVAVTGVMRDRIEELTREFGLSVAAPETPTTVSADADATPRVLHKPRIALYSPWTGGNI